jgi:hypothetical protein
MEIVKVKSMKTAQRAIGSMCKSFQSCGPCHDKNSEQVGNSASTQLVGFCHDNKSEQVTFIKQEKDAVLLYYLWSKHTQHRYKGEPLQKHCCTDSGIQSKFIFTNEKTNGRQQLTHAAYSEEDTLRRYFYLFTNQWGSNQHLCI